MQLLFKALSLPASPLLYVCVLIWLFVGNAFKTKNNNKHSPHTTGRRHHLLEISGASTVKRIFCEPQIFAI